MLLTDREFAPIVQKALALMGDRRPLVVEVDDDTAPRAAPGQPGLRGAGILRRPAVRLKLPADEWDAIALNYTSGTTGNPKGVVTHHRGAPERREQRHQLGLPQRGVPVDAADVPLQRLVLPLDLAARAGTNVCLRRVEPALIFDMVREHGVTHLCGAPIVTRC